MTINESVVNRKRDRVIRTILQARETHLPADEGSAAVFRKVVLDQLNDFTEVVLSLLEAEPDYIVNEAWVDLLTRRLEAIEQRLA